MKPINHHIKRHFGVPTQYLSISESRRLSVELPVGDPFGGAAYGMRSMPVMPVVAGLGSFGAAAGSAMTFMSGLKMVGAVLGVVGAITGNKTLGMIGAVVGIGAGLIGGMSSAAGGLAETVAEAGGAGGAEVLGGGMSEAATAAASDVSAGAIPGVEMSGDIGGGMIADGGGLMGGGLDASGGLSASGPDGGMLPDASAAASPGVQIDAGQSPYETGAQDTMSAGTLSQTSAFETGVAGGPTTQSGGLISSGSASGGGMFDKFGTFVKNNKELVKVGTDMIGGLIPSNKQKAELELQRAQAEAIRAQTAREQERQLWRKGLINS